jgi:hypothetical protein
VRDGPPRKVNLPVTQKVVLSPTRVLLDQRFISLSGQVGIEIFSLQTPATTRLWELPTKWITLNLSCQCGERGSDRADPLSGYPKR